MGKAKVAITLEEETLEKVDRLIKLQVFPNRSRAIQEAVEEKLERLERSRLAVECAKLDQPLKRPWPKRACLRIWRHGPNTEGRNTLGRSQSGTRPRAGEPAACPHPQSGHLQRALWHG